MTTAPKTRFERYRGDNSGLYEPRVCTKCDTLKPIEEYGMRSSSTVPGRKIPKRICKDCVRSVREQRAEEYQRDGSLRPTHKVCSLCEEYMPVSVFPTNRAQKDGYQNYCKECYSKTQLNRLYGLSIAEFEAMHAAQKGLCAICQQPETTMQRQGSDTEKKPKRLAVDHCHETGKVRRLLCSFCNRGLGFFKDKPELLAAALQYLNDHN